jgi:hypothetical protein
MEGGLPCRWSMRKGRGGEAFRRRMNAGEGMCRLSRNKGGVQGVFLLGMTTQCLLGTTRHLGGVRVRATLVHQQVKDKSFLYFKGG